MDKVIKKKRTRVLIVDGQVFSEGVSFFGVKRLILVNPPSTHYKF